MQISFEKKFVVVFGLNKAQFPSISHHSINNTSSWSTIYSHPSLPRQTDHSYFIFLSYTKSASLSCTDGGAEAGV